MEFSPLILSILKILSILLKNTAWSSVENDNVVFRLRGDTSSHQEHSPNALRTTKVPEM